jgi:hypothetical protein
VTGAVVSVSDISVPSVVLRGLRAMMKSSPFGVGEHTLLAAHCINKIIIR